MLSSTGSTSLAPGHGLSAGLRGPQGAGPTLCVPSTRSRGSDGLPGEYFLLLGIFI